MAMLPLKSGIIYGPVNSRRLGRSLGINLLPTSHKLCSFDCAYCHYGRTQIKTLYPEEAQFPTVEDVLQAVREGLETHPDIDYLTFSGNGEATLHPRFLQIAAGVRKLRDELRPGAGLTILSNSSTVHLRHIRETLAGFEAPIMKLDAGDQKTLARLNRPTRDFSLEQTIEGLKDVPGLIIQSVLVDGPMSNVRSEPYQAWLAALSEIGPAQVQIYSTDRPVPDAGIKRVPPSELQRIAEDINKRTELRVNAYWVQS